MVVVILSGIIAVLAFTICFWTALNDKTPMIPVAIYWGCVCIYWILRVIG